MGGIGGNVRFGSARKRIYSSETGFETRINDGQGKQELNQVEIKWKRNGWGPPSCVPT